MKSNLRLMVVAAGLVAACSGREQETNNALAAGEAEVNVLEDAAVNLQKAADNATTQNEADALQNQAEAVGSVASNQAEVIENATTNAQ
jgi:hypothetical protein